jgi:hypothetical protein
MLLREQKLPRSRDRRAHTGAQTFNFSEAKLGI